MGNVSPADELVKLAELKEKGVLTEEEFAEQKSRILSARHVRSRGPAMRLLTSMLFVAAIGLAEIGSAGTAAAAEARVTGTATYADRAKLPSGAVLNVVLEDVSLADAPAMVIADTRENLGAAPHPFSLTYDPAVIDPRHTYAVRARVTLDDRLLMTTDTHDPVITRDAPMHVELILRPVKAAPGAGGLVVYTAPGLTLPASFTGTTPMASGPGMAWHLDLWPDQVYHLRQTIGDGEPAYDLGRWHADPARDAIVLRGGREAPLLLEVLHRGDLRLMDLKGNPIESDLPYNLSAEPLQPVEDTQFLTGMFRHMDDAATFTECLTGRTFPIATEGAYIEAKRAYARLEERTPGSPVLAILEGRLAMRPGMEGSSRTQLEIESFSRFDPEWTCATTGGYTGAEALAELTNTYWNILDIAGDAVTVVENRREPHLILGKGETASFKATVGCNMLRGGYETEGDSLSFSGAAMTRIACPPPLDGMERALARILPLVARWKIDGPMLHLFDESGGRVLTAEAVYLY